MKCSNCNKSISKEKAEYCPSCGHEVGKPIDGSNPNSEYKNNSLTTGKKILVGIFVLFLASLSIGNFSEESNTDTLDNETDPVTENQPTPLNEKQDTQKPLTEVVDSTSGSYGEGQLYRNSEHNFRIRFPEGWEVTRGEGKHVTREAVSPEGVGSVNVLVKEIPYEGPYEGLDIRDIMESPESYKNDLVNESLDRFSDVEVLDYGMTQLANRPAFWMKYSGSYNALDLSVRMTQMYFQLLEGNKIYNLTAGAASDRFDRMQSKMMPSIASFVIEDYYE